MKKYLFLLLAAVSFGFVSCDDSDTDPGATAVVEMAGEWDVMVSVVNADGSVVDGDPLGLGMFKLSTFNTAANTADQMWITDGKKFWNFQFKVDLNYGARTFTASERNYDAAGSGKAQVLNGKVLKNASLTSHGVPNDSIVFDIKFSDDRDALVYRVSGQRYTGFTD